MAGIFDGKRVLLGVSGGIAAYKSVELLRLLTAEGANVRVVMTENARWFVGPGTFQALSGLPVCTSVFAEGDASIRHIDWAREAELVVVAPATANILGKIAGGIADDALTTLMLAVTAPVALCPAMNTHMYEHPAVRRNLRILADWGFSILEPDAGELACGTVGPGRLPDPPRILEFLRTLLTPQDFAGVPVLVTAGPTHEYLDPVRFIGNPSSGKMGFALARAAASRGADVTLVTGPVSLPDPWGVRTVRVTSAKEMAAEVLDRLEGARIVVKAAAVSDYGPAERADQKLKKHADTIRLDLVRNMDILREVGRNKGGRILVGFAAETRDLRENALEKLRNKRLDLIVANAIGPPESGFRSDTNTVTLLFGDGREEALPTMDKLGLAHHILTRIAEMISDRRA